MRIISIINQKGGVGKTTTAHNLGTGLKMLNRNVLVIDLDSQSSLSILMEEISQKYSILDVLLGEVSIEDIIVKTKYFDLIPSNKHAAIADVKLWDKYNREYLLKKSIANIKNYDYILIDCPPAAGILTLNALAAASEVLIPLEAEYLAMEALSELLRSIAEIKQFVNSDLKITGILLTKFNKRLKSAQKVHLTTQKAFPDLMLKSIIHKNVHIVEASARNKPIYYYKSNSIGARDYNDLAQEIINQENTDGKRHR